MENKTIQQYEFINKRNRMHRICQCAMQRSRRENKTDLGVRGSGMPLDLR
jgi:hypothetical protein